MSQKYEKLKTLLKELFQLDQPDLDFGLYRIMHAKSAEVTQFLDKDLLPQVKQAFGLYKTADKAELEKELAKAIEQAQALGADPETPPKVRNCATSSPTKRWTWRTGKRSLRPPVQLLPPLLLRRRFPLPSASTSRASMPSPMRAKRSSSIGPTTTSITSRPASTCATTHSACGQTTTRTQCACILRLADAAEGSTAMSRRLKARIASSFFSPANPRDSSPRRTANSVIRFEYRPATLTDWPEDVRAGKTKPPSQKDLIAFADETYSGRRRQLHSALDRRTRQAARHR